MDQVLHQDRSLGRLARLQGGPGDASRRQNPMASTNSGCYQNLSRMTYRRALENRNPSLRLLRNEISEVFAIDGGPLISVLSILIFV